MTIMAASSGFNRMLTGDGHRRSRLHDCEGRFVGFSRLLHLPLSIGTALLVKTAGWRLERPWLGYSAVHRLAGLIRPNWSILEFGSGLSTVWLARRSADVVSLEHDRDWHARVGQILEGRNLRNVDLRFSAEADYARAPIDDGRQFDFVLVDGIARLRSAHIGFAQLKPGGWLYLDNADMPDFRDAAQFLRAQKFAVTERFTDLTPGQVLTTTGLLVQKAA